MGSAARRAALAAAIFVLLAGAIAAAAVVDHRHERSLLPAANQASWYCQNRDLRCEEAQAEEVAAAWHRRERFYRAGFAVMLSIGLSASMLAAVLGVRGRAPRPRKPVRPEEI